MFLLLVMTTSLNAQSIEEVIIGSGDDYTHVESPANFFSNYSFSQIIYTADEIDKGNGFITSISFRLQENDFIRKIAIYMQNTDKEQFVDNKDYVAITEDDLVFEGNVDFTPQTGGYVKITLDTPFKYSGGNLLVSLDDNTGDYEDEVAFYHYPICTVEENIIRTISSYSDNNDLTADNAASMSDGSFDPGRKGFNICPQVKFDIILGNELPVFSINPIAIDLGYCANDAWNPTQKVNVSALNKDVNITITSISNSNEYFKISEITTPYELTTDTPLEIEVTPTKGEGEVLDSITISYDDKETQIKLRAYAYNPKANDVYELATTIEEFPFTARPNYDEIYSNYVLPGSAEKGKDVVYKIVLEKETKLSASVEGANGKVVLYPADFGGKEGPMTDNYYGVSSSSVVSNSFEHITAAGEYYIVASATEAFTLNVENDVMPLPKAASLQQPWNNDTEISAPVFFQWYLGDYTEEYQVLLGTTNPPTDVLIDWTNNPETSYILEEIAPSTVFYWQVKSRNSSGVTESNIHKFTTILAAPTNLTFTPKNIYEGEDITLSWNAVADVLGYNVYLDDVKMNKEIVTDTSFTFNKIEYKAEGYKTNVSAVHKTAESQKSKAAYFYVCTETEVVVSVFEQDGTTAITDVKVTLKGTDIAGNEQVYSLPTEAGYRCKVFTGTYVAIAEKEGYQITEKEFVAEHGKTSEISLTLNETYYPARWVKAEESEKSVKVSWDINAMPMDFEDFELGSLTARDWVNNSAYPWVITSDAYEGEYAMKSACENVKEAKSSIEINVDIKEAGLLSFYHKISSEKDTDFGKFYIDGKLMDSISGDVKWQYEEFYVTAGKHIYRWEYAKDSLTDLGLDAYFVDNITFCKAIEPEANVWIKYDNGEYSTSIGGDQIAPLYWGIKVPNTYLYAGNNLTKVALYDYEAATYTANIYVGGNDAPQSLVSTQKFTTTGSKTIFEVKLTTPVTIDPEQTLWITMYCDELYFPAPACISQDNPNGDYISSDGKTWDHITAANLPYTWILRGYVEGKNDRSTRHFANRSFTSKYNVYKRNVFTKEQTLLSENTTEKTYTDNTWGDVKTGAFQWGVAALYEGNRDSKTSSSRASESEIVWSNVLGKNMSTKVTVNVKTNTGDPVAGTEVIFKNLIEEKYSYNISLDEKGVCVIEDFRKGEYELTISLGGFESTYSRKEVSIWDEQTFNCELTEVLVPVSNLYTSPTAYVMWENGSVSNKGEEFYFDFEDGTMNGWVTIDADGDNFSWENFKEMFADEASNIGNNNSEGGVKSNSFYNYVGPLTPDNYLVTEKKYKIGENSQFVFYVAGIDDRYQEEHYGVAISTKGNTSAADFVTIYEETLPPASKSGFSRADDTKGNRNTRGYGKYFKRVIDLSDYAGKSIYIALRHFNITDMYAICADDLSLINAPENRALNSYELYLNDSLVSDDLKVTHYQFENLVDGQEYKTTVIPVYTKGKGEATDYIWTYSSCDKFDGVTDFKAEFINEETVITWTLPEEEVLGVNLYRNDTLVAELVKGEEYIDKDAEIGDEISLVIVYGGKKDVTYYAKSCPQSTTVIYNMPCVAPKNLHAYNTINEDGTFGATLVWPYTEAESNWLYYDSGEFLNGIGGPDHFYWGIMFPISKLENYAGASITKVSLYNYLENGANEGKFHIYFGGDNAPEVLTHSQEFSTTDIEQFVEFDLTYPLPISGEENVWIVIETELGSSFPASCSEGSVDKNARWISEDGKSWEDVAESGLDISWMIRAYISTDKRGTLMLGNEHRAPTLTKYNIYRGSSLNNIEKISETTERNYFDKVEAGTYYYQVKAVYEEYGETCESDAANSYFNPEQDYVVVEVSAINENGVNGLMIYPNPTNCNLNIEAESMRRITIANALGQIVYDQEVDSDNTIIDMTQYESGIYMVQIVTDNGVATKRVSVL